MSQLLELSKLTTIVADTGDIDSIAKIKPQDATTNPSLILKAASDPNYADLVNRAVRDTATVDEAADRVLVNFGCEILKHIPGRVSTEVDARLSFDTAQTVEKARQIIAMYEAAGIDKNRILIKIAATWEGVQAAKILEKEGIHCNLTLIFSLAQAEIAAMADATLISPFVGRIYDWYKKKAGPQWNELANFGPNDPGVRSVKLIFERLKGMGAKTQIMGASFRNKGEILALAGCDLLTISPKLIAELSACEEAVPQQLFKDAVEPCSKEDITQSDFLFTMCSNEMATEKLSEGIRNFVIDNLKLKAMLTSIKGN